MSEVDLDPELKKCVVDVASGMTMIKHPVLFEVFYTPALNHIYNERFALKLKAIEKAYDESNWTTYVYLHERPYRLEAALGIAAEFGESSKEWWELLGAIWSDSENIWQCRKVWADLIAEAREDRDASLHFMTDEDREFYHKLPSTLSRVIGLGIIPRYLVFV